MTDRPPVSGEPSTEAGRNLLRQFYPAGNRLPVLEDEMRRDILAIEAEARATPPALDVERLAEAMRRIGYIVYEGDPDDDNMCPNCVTPWKCNGPHILKERPDANDKEAAKVAAEYARLSPHNREAGE